jgi:hypothetical protein
VNLAAAMVVVFFFLVAIVTYIVHGALGDTANHFEEDTAITPSAMAALIVEIGGFAVLLAGFVAGQFF